MDIDHFWQMIADSRATANGDNPDGNMTRQMARLKTALAALPREEVVAFDRRFTKLMHQAYRWDLWRAAYVIEQGCSEDGFMDFRSWLISMGRDAYEAALADPESLVVAAGDPTVEACAFEELLNLSTEILGEEINDDIEHPPEPAGESWQGDEDELRRRLPKLFAKFMSSNDE